MGLKGAVGFDSLTRASAGSAGGSASGAGKHSREPNSFCGGVVPAGAD